MAKWIQTGPHTKTQTWDSLSPVNGTYSVARWGKDWRTIYAGSEPGDGAETGPVYPSKAVAIAYALKRTDDD